MKLFYYLSINKMDKMDKKKEIIEYSKYTLKFQWVKGSLYKLVISMSPSVVSFKIDNYAQLIFETNHLGHIIKQPSISVAKMIRKMESMLLITHRTELIFSKTNNNAFGVIYGQKKSDKVIKIGEIKIKQLSAFTVGILRENYSTSINEIAFKCNIQAVSTRRLEEIKSKVNK